MRDCYVFVLPSISEGLPRVILEAMALAKPAIASNVGGISEVVKDGVNGFLIEPKNISKLVEKIEHLIGFPDVAREMGGEGRKFVADNFSNEKYIANYIKMINS